ncbi:MAG: NAD(P)H-dependent oxidoreductase subunit E, partial [Elusimicrobia bacterium]|nr:NAD(P)H-dependent oxidoreductase subunit E [Elusimicrobiota bacterium]
MKTAKQTSCGEGSMENRGLFTREQQERLASWKKRYPYPIMGIVEALRDVQQWHRSVSLEAEAHVAELFQVPLPQVHELVTFYPYFTTEPAGRCRIQVCRNLSCHLAGSARALDHLRSSLGVEEGRATPDGLFSYEAAECLGACDFAPAFTVNDELIGEATGAALDRVLARARSGETAPDENAGVRAEEPRQRGGASSGVRIVMEHFDDAQLHSLEAYRRAGGYRAWEKAQTMEAGRIVAEVKKSNLRGLGGAGFPSGMKWETVPPKKDRRTPHYLVANADESEPGCFKDRILMERNPHALIEGMLIAGRAIEADGLFIFIRGEYARQNRVLEAAVREASEAGILKQNIFIMRGASAYISGCDTALLETMEGKKAWPRQPPPFPTVNG